MVRNHEVFRQEKMTCIYREEYADINWSPTRFVGRLIFDNTNTNHPLIMYQNLFVFKYIKIRKIYRI